MASPQSHPVEDSVTQAVTEDRTETGKPETDILPEDTQAVPLPDEQAQPVSLSPDNTHHSHEVVPSNTDTATTVSSQPEHLAAEQTLSEDMSLSEEEVCFYYDSRKYDQVLRDTYKAAVKDCVDGDDINTSCRAPDLDQIINGHPLRMYKRTAKVGCIQCKHDTCFVDPLLALHAVAFCGMELPSIIVLYFTTVPSTKALQQHVLQP